MADIKNYNRFTIIFYSFIKYLPSRFLVILNSIIIIPFYAYILSSNEMGIYQLILGILNLLCTCSTDWITKATLRFYEKYKIRNQLSDFFSNIIIIFTITYILILINYCIFSQYIAEKYFIPKDLLFLTLILIIPCGIRQLLYQILRVYNKPLLYTFSIIVYQFAHLLLFLLLFKTLNNVKAILIAMTIAMIIIDVYIIKKIQFNIKFTFTFKPNLLGEILKYSLPTIFTNSGIWLILHMNKFTFQRIELFNYTATAGIAWAYTSYILTPLLSTFLFAVFPLIIKKFEYKQKIKYIITNTIQLYFFMFVPLISTFILYSKEITTTVFSEKYNQAYIIIPFFAMTIFLHELMKILNIKYHLKNKTYIEMLITSLLIILCIILNIKLIPIYHLLGAGIAMLFSMIILIILNSIINFSNFDYIIPKQIFKTVIYTTTISLIIFILTQVCTTNIIHGKLEIIKPIFYTITSYTIIWKLKHRILN